MRNTIRCQCQFEFPVSPEDSGFSVYCPSCGQECAVPAGADGNSGGGAPVDAQAAVRRPPPSAEAVALGAAAARSRRQPSVFANDGSGEWRATPIAEVVCLCGGRVAVTVDDYGGTVYCPSCAAELPVGDRVDPRAEPRPRTALKPPTEPAPSKPSTAPAIAPAMPPSAPRPQFWGSTAGWLAFLGVVVVMAAVGLLLRKSGLASPAVSQSDAPSLDSSQAVPLQEASPTRVEPPSDDGHEMPVNRAASITLEAIEGLLQQDDKHMALVDADDWQDVLEVEGIPDDEPRRKRLAEVRGILLDELREKPTPPDPDVEAFANLLSRLREALFAQDLEQARRLNDQAEMLFAAKPGVLAFQSARWRRLQVVLRQLQGNFDGLRRLEELLDESKRDGAAGRVTEAFEKRAQALLIWARDVTNVSQLDQERLHTVALELAKALRLAVGRRAVEDAQRCHDAGDREARDAQLKIAKRDLPDAPGSQSKPLLTDAERLSKQSIARPQPSTLGRQLALRAAYEAALDHCKPANSAALVCAAAEFERLDGAARSDYRGKLALLVFDILEGQLGEVAARTTTPSQTVAALVALEQALAGSSFYKSHQRWQSLWAAVEQQGSQIAGKAIDQAAALKDRRSFEQAIGAVTPATQVGTTEQRHEAQRLLDDCRREIKLAESEAAQAEHWQRIEARAREGNVVAVWREIRPFEERYPGSTYQDRLNSLKDRLQGDVERKIDEIVALAERLWGEKKWAEFLAQVEQLEWLPPSSARQAACEQLRAKRDRLRESAIDQLELARGKARMATEDEVLAVLAAAGEVLAIEPGHAEAGELLARARQIAGAMAAKLMRSAELYGRDKRNERMLALYKKKLESVARLDAEGDLGHKARKALAGLKGK